MYTIMYRQRKLPESTIEQVYILLLLGALSREDPLIVTAVIVLKR